MVLQNQRSGAFVISGGELIREELPYFPTTGFRCEVLTDDPAVRKQVDDIFYDFFGEENPHQIEDYQNEPEQGMTFGGV